MRFSELLHVVPLAGAALAISPRDGPVTAESNFEGTKKFILEVTPGTDVDALSTELSSRRGARILKTFKSDVFYGLSVETEHDNVDSLQDFAQVAKAWPMSQLYLAPSEPTAVFDSDIAAKNYSVHQWTGVDKAHEVGILGKGATVAIIDTGIDYNHPALGGGFGPGFKVAGGWDLVGDGWWPSPGEVKQEDADPMDLEGHGTHVAGIIAGDGEWFKGVAPEATLLIYKVFTASAGTDEDTLIDAFIMAYEANADVITSSVGGVGGFASGPWATIASRIAEKGVIVTISAGNDGKHGPFYGSSGSSGKEVLAIASAAGGSLPGVPFKMTFSLNGESQTDQFGYLYYPDPWDIKDWPIYPLSLDTTDPAQACQPMTDVPDLSDKIVLIRKGGCDLLDKEWNLRPFNVTYMMFYNDEDKPAEPWSWLFDEHKALIDAAAGVAIVETIKAGGAVTGDFTPFPDPDQFVGMFNSVGNRPNGFTSWGGLYDMDLKPEVAAPGGLILSTFPGGSWVSMSGTSMSCPYVAGVAALYIGKYGGRSVYGEGFGKMLRNKIVSSGAAMPWSTFDGTKPLDTGFWAPTPQVGSGLINAWKVLNYSTQLSFDKFNLNDTHHFSRYHSVDITNNANTAVTYTFTLQPAAGIEAKGVVPPGLAVLTDLTPIKMVPEVSFPSGTFKVQPGKTKKAQFSFSYPKGLVESKLPVYSGKILISGSNGEELSIPYFGGAFNVKKEFDTVFEKDSVFGRVGGNPQYDLFNKTFFTFDTTVRGVPTAQDYLRVFASFKWGCNELRWDIFEPGYKERSWTYPPVVGVNGYVGSVAIFRESERFSYFDPSVHDAEDTVAFPLREVSRNSKISYTRHSYYWLGKLANGTYIAPGNYSMRFAALRPFGTRENADNWDVWQTPTITVLPKP